jgi:hypothetical protein
LVEQTDDSALASDEECGPFRLSGSDFRAELPVDGEGIVLDSPACSTA